ncbi:MAG: hypothetical protein HRU14_13245 [Planctomycetes bacterium]|nr:hypothetical protein [Planctomycetota bacterium]
MKTPSSCHEAHVAHLPADIKAVAAAEVDEVTRGDAAGGGGGSLGVPSRATG